MRVPAGVALLLTAALCLSAREPERARHAMVVTQEPLATDIGVRILKQGGNAVDAAVAVGFALAVTYPYAGNLGGGGFLLLRAADGKATFFDFRERAPLKATRTMYVDAPKESLEGWRSAGVPGTVRGLELAHKRFGKLKWAEVLRPAIELAEHGFAVSYFNARSLSTARNLASDPESKRILLKGGAYYQPGDTLRQPELAATLKRIAAAGAHEFYEGETAQRLAREMAAHGGLITLEDLKQYAAVEREPLQGSYKGYGIITAPPPSAGGPGMLQMLGMLEGSNYEKTGAGSAATLHFLAEVMRRYYADRSAYLGDPDFAKLPLSGMLDRAYIERRRASIDPQQATPSSQVGGGKPAGREGSETTHFNVVDPQGNAVAMTYTLNEGYGNGITVPGLGFLLNNEMDDFAARPGMPNLFGLIQGETNAIAPGKRPLSSMTPTILTKDGKLFLLAGAPGGSRIISAVLQVILNVIDFGMNVQDAIDRPRIHHQWQPDTLYVEGGMSPDTVELLRGRGHKIDFGTGVVNARVQGIVLESGWIAGAWDGRGSGKAAGF